MESALIEAIIRAAEGSEWTVLAGGILLAVVWLVRRITQGRISPNGARFLVAGLAVAVDVGTMLMADVVWYRALTLAFLVGGTAAGFWSLLGERIFPKV